MAATIRFFGSDPLTAVLFRLRPEISRESVTTDQHVRRLMKLLQEDNPPIRAAVRAGTSEPPARKYARLGQIAAWLGLVPKQESSGGKTVLLGISKRGDIYLRTLLIHGARAVLWVAQRRKAPMDRWVQAARAT